MTQPSTSEEHPYIARLLHKGYDVSPGGGTGSTDDPPDIIEGTPPFDDIEDAFGITVDDDAALELYDMDLDEAAARILDMQRRQGGAGQGNG